MVCEYRDWAAQPQQTAAGRLHIVQTLARLAAISNLESCFTLRALSYQHCHSLTSVRSQLRQAFL